MLTVKIKQSIITICIFLLNKLIITNSIELLYIYIHTIYYKFKLITN